MPELPILYSMTTYPPVEQGVTGSVVEEVGTGVLTITGPTTAIEHTNVTFSGKLTGYTATKPTPVPLPNQQVYLILATPSGMAYTIIGTPFTDASGNWTFTWAIESPLKYSPTYGDVWNVKASWGSNSPITGLPP